MFIFLQEEEDGEPMGDVDLFALSADGAALTVNSKWLQHLEERLLGEDGHPRKAREGEDPHRSASSNSDTPSHSFTPPIIVGLWGLAC